jgi:hypothetical protein
MSPHLRYDLDYEDILLSFHLTSQESIMIFSAENFVLCALLLLVSSAGGDSISTNEKRNLDVISMTQDDPPTDELASANAGERELTIDHDDPYHHFNFFTTSEEWTRCKLEYEAKCYPIVSIEEAACRADLIVWGRVIDENSAGDRQISVNWESYVHGKSGPRTRQKHFSCSRSCPF